MASSSTGLWSVLTLLVMASLAVTAVFLFTCVSIYLVVFLKAVFAFIAYIILTAGEIFVAVVAALTSGATVTMTVILASLVAAVSFPPSRIEARVGACAAVAASGIVAASGALLTLGSMRVDLEVSAAIVSAASCAVAFASAWAVGVMSLIEKDTHQVGLKMTSIMDCVRHNNYFLLRILVGLRTPGRKDLEVGLLYAVKAGFRECTTVLLYAGASPNVRDGYDNTPLILACETGATDIAGVLLEKGAQVDTRNGGRGTALHAAAKWGYAPCVELMLESGADPNVQDGLWRTPLMLAAKHAPQADVIMATLIRAGSDVKIVGGENRTVVHYAAARGLDVAALVRAGADPFSADAEGNTPLHFAAKMGHVTTVELLLTMGADPDVINYQKMSPIHGAAVEGGTAVIATLTRHGANINCLDQSNNTPVWFAARNGHLNATVYFLKSNCHLPESSAAGKRLPESHRWTHMASNPLEAALERRQFEIAKCLVIGGCDTAPLADWLTHIPPFVLDEASNVEHVDWLKTCIHNPWSLVHHCRQVIRQRLGFPIQNSVQSLPLPGELKGYVLLSDLDEVSRIVLHDGNWSDMKSPQCGNDADVTDMVHVT